MTKRQKNTLMRIIVSAVLLIGVIVLEKTTVWPAWTYRVLVLVPYFIIGHDVLRKALLGIKNRQVFDENFLMATATVGAMILGETTEGVAVMLFYQIGELFQQLAVGRSRRSISALMDIRPDYANIEQEDGTLEQVDPDDVETGTVIVVQPGERIPIDGVVVEGNSSLNTAALTGESLPREVMPGDDVISGCVNNNGLLKVRTTKPFEESTVSRILDLVENSSMKKAKAENFIAKFARVYTPAVCGSALALAVIPPVVLGLAGQGWNFGTWVFRALTFLVISCPCALVVSIPLSFFGGIGGASRNGILVKGSNYLEALADASVVVFDKTGTLTKGVFEVTEIIPAEGITSAELLECAALAESYSTHPVAKSLRNAIEKQLDQSRVGAVEEIAGHGVKAEVDGHEILAGNARLMDHFGVQYIPNEAAGTSVYAARDGQFLGSVTINDVLKEDTVEALRQMKACGIRRTVMLTGDAEQAAAAVAGKTGVDEYHSGLLPADKVDWIEKLLQEKTDKEVLCFVGDGINDAPVLSRADVGIAMGALGSDAAIEAADIVLMDDDIAKIPKAVMIARKCLRIVRENVVFAIGVKLICLVLSAFGYANMWWAVFADVGVMVLAVLNATRTLAMK